ncbi:MAG: hypothetical protein AAF928_21825 [Myxococcota bacterium]
MNTTTTGARRAGGFGMAALMLCLGCKSVDTTAPQPRKRAADRDGACPTSTRPHAYFYPAENRTDYAPDDPFADGCEMLVPDHLFCCPERRPSSSPSASALAPP